VVESGLPIEQLRQLQVLASEGDVIALRGKLEELAEVAPAQAPFVERLAELVSAYRIDEFEMLLQQAISESATAAPGPGALQSVNEAGTVAP
jgi:hypothetical protein